MNEIEFSHPFVKSFVAKSNDVDAMADLLLAAKEHREKLWMLEDQLRIAIAQHSKSENKTSRIKGKRHTIKVVKPADKWDQRTLRAVWDGWLHAGRYLKISTFSAQAREVAKLESMSGDEEFEAWKNRLLSARSESTSAPYITVELEKEATKNGTSMVSK